MNVRATPAARLSAMDRVRCGLILLVLALLVAIPARLTGESTIFGGGPFYVGGTATMNALRSSGFTKVMLWCIHVDQATGNLIFNDQLVVANGVYVGNSAWPSQLATLKTPPTSVNRIGVSVGSWGVDDFLKIKNLMDTYGTNSDSILYRNFQALKVATGADSIDFDDETHYQVDTAVRFGRMLASIGYKVTLCPYTQSTFWQNVYNQLGTNIVEAVYLQCYAGGGGNNPATWNNYFPGTRVQPGMWCRHGNGCSEGSTAAEVEAQMTSWRASAGIPGGFMWLYDDMLSCTVGGTPAQYARAINTAVDPFQVLPSAGFSAITAYNLNAFPASTVFTLTNGAGSSMNWSLINTSSWLSVSLLGGSLGANGSTTVTVDLNLNAATNLQPGSYSATVLFSNRTTSVVRPRSFSLNTAVANWPLQVNGFNMSLVVPRTGTPANPGAAALDVPNNYCFYESGLAGGTRGLPADGVIASRVDPATAFQIAPYSSANALRLGYSSPAYGTLTLNTPQALNSIAVLASSANGGGQGTFVVNFQDGSKSPVFRYNAQDWFFVVTNVAAQGFGRVRLGASFTIENNGDSNPNLYQTVVNLAEVGLTQPVVSVTFSNPVPAGAQQTTAILGLSGMPSSTPLPPPQDVVADPGTNKTVALSWRAVNGAIGYNIRRSTTNGGPYDLVGHATGTNALQTGLENGITYHFVISAVGVSNESSNSVEASAMPGSYRAWLTATGPAGYWPLDETAGPIAFERIRGSNGVSSGSYVAGLSGPVGAGFGSPHRAMYYDGGSGHTQIPRLIGSTNFSIVFWVQTTATGGTPQWYNGRGLVDGEVGGAAADFGVSLVGLRVGFGVGSPDTTLQSVRLISNGQWNQVVVTRNSGNGEMRIYINGTLDAGMTGPTGPRTAPPALRIAGLQTGVNFLNGRMSEVAVYDRVLNAAEVAMIYNSAAGSFYDVTLNSAWNGTNLILSWLGNGKLLQATNVLGPWTTNFAPSPVSIQPVEPQRYYRIQTH